MAWPLVLGLWLVTAGIAAPPALAEPAPSTATTADSVTVELNPGELRARPGATALGVLTVTNSGAEPITISAVELVSWNDALALFGEAMPWTLPAGGSKAIKVQFRPVGEGRVESSVRFAVGSSAHSFRVEALGDPAAALGMNNDAGEVVIGVADVRLGAPVDWPEVAPAAIETPPLVVAVSPPKLTAPVGSTVWALVTIRNDGEKPILVRRLAVLDEAGPLQLTGLNVPFTLPPGVSEVLSLRFTADSVGASSAVVRILTDAGTSEVSVAVVGEAPARGPDGAYTLGAVDKSLIYDEVQRNMHRVRYCYQRELGANPTLAGKITVRFVIAQDGSVRSAETKSSTMNNASVEACLNAAFLQLRFPEPRGNGIVIASYPFVFEP